MIKKEVWYVGAVLLVAIVGGVVVSCKDVILDKPSDQEARLAVSGLTKEIWTVIFGVPLPAEVIVATAKVQQCDSAEPQAGVRCKVNLVTQEFPIIGSLSTSWNFRFSKEGRGWVAYWQ